jgi:hypothetical protein
VASACASLIGIVIAHMAQQPGGKPVMQKMLFATVSALALGAAATAALAQGGSTTYLSQTGTSQKATIDQTGATNGQVGTLGSPFTQSDGSSGGNVISITQSGSGNAVGVSSPSFQAGSSNNSTITQNGTNGGVVLQQTGSSNGTIASYTGVITQDTLSSGDTVSVTETGNSLMNPLIFK